MSGDGNDVTRPYVDAMRIQQPDDSVLNIRGGSDYKLYEEVLRDDQVHACFEQRRRAVVGKELQVDAGGTSKKDKAAADYLREQLNNVGFDRATDMMLYGIHYGHAVSEMMYASDGRFHALAGIKVRNRRRFGFDGAGRLRMRTVRNPAGELMPDKKFWAYSIGADHDDDHYGKGLGHWLYWPAFFKRNGLSYWLLFLEKFGQPTAKGEYDSNTATEKDVNTLLQALTAINTDSAIAIPKGMAVELLQAARSGTADYVALYDRMDAAIAKVILGQTASTQGTPGKLGNDELQGDVRLDLIKADADLICESFNRTVVPWLIDWNFGDGAALPRVYRKIEQAEDTNKRAERDSKIYQMGFTPELEYINETYGGKWREREGAVAPSAPKNLPAPDVIDMDMKPSVDLESVQQAALNGAQIKSLSDVIGLVQSGELDRTRARALIEVGFPAIATQQIDRLLGTTAQFSAAEQSPAEQMLDAARSHVEPASNAWINNIKALAEKAESLEQLRDELLSTYPDMTLDAYAEAMATVTTASKLAGRNAVVEERQ